MTGMGPVVPVGVTGELIVLAGVAVDVACEMPVLPEEQLARISPASRQTQLPEETNDR